jgi:hypothetical protein
MDGFIEEIIQYSDESWIDILGSYEHPKIIASGYG